MKARNKIVQSRCPPDNLPIRGQFYLLSDGERYAEHGMSENEKGVLVFYKWEKAEEFRRTIGAGMPEFKTVQVTPEKVFQEFVRHGAMCVLDGEKGTLYEIHEKPGGPNVSALADELPSVIDGLRQYVRRSRAGTGAASEGRIKNEKSQ